MCRSPDEWNNCFSSPGIVLKLGEVPLVAHGTRNNLVNGDPGPHKDPSLVASPEDPHEAGVHDDLTHVVGARYVLEQGAFWYGVRVRVLDLEIGKYLVSFKLVVPGNYEDQGQDD